MTNAKRGVCDAGKHMAWCLVNLVFLDQLKEFRRNYNFLHRLHIFKALS